jgi:hypothetical protein
MTAGSPWKRPFAPRTPASLPVLTIANAQQVLQSRDYAERVAVRLLDYLLNIDNLRSTGRLYLP